MGPAGSTCRIEQQDETIILIPLTNLGELDFERFSQEVSQVLDLLKEGKACNAVIDLGHTDYFGSQTVGFFLRLWKTIKQRGGKMALCQLSDHERQLLELMKLDAVWPLCASREEAMATVAH